MPYKNAPLPTIQSGVVSQQNGTWLSKPNWFGLNYMTAKQHRMVYCSLAGRALCYCFASHFSLQHSAKVINNAEPLSHVVITRQ